MCANCFLSSSSSSCCGRSALFSTAIARCPAERASTSISSSPIGLEPAESYERGRILREGVPCVILGRPNAGKSTLLNTLLGRERAIVTDIPGTTRDLIEENVKVGQILLRVTDTAGLRDTTDPVEQAGIDRAMAEASASALILAVFDGSRSRWCAE